MMSGLKERDLLSNTFGRYVDQEIARKLMARPDATRLGGEKRQVVIHVFRHPEFHSHGSRIPLKRV